ncbi:MAG: hypothetical protein K2I75_05175 [Clostridiales bacterium]|nr:hypothetical protein [Clostridiales bacterium]
MVSKAKKWFIVSSAACAALSVALCITVTHIAYANEDDSKPCDNRVTISTEMAQVALEDFQSTISSFNQVYNYDWSANYIEYMCDVYLGDDGVWGIYVDLDGDNGYYAMTIDDTGHHWIYDWAAHGDLECVRDYKKNIYFDCWNGYMYKDGFGNYHRFESDNDDDDWDMQIGSSQQTQSVED